MKKKILFVIGVAMLLVGMALASSSRSDRTNNALDSSISSISAFEDLYTSFMQASLPDSLDKFYVNSTPETPSSEWVGEMFIQAGAFDGMVGNLQAGDIANATVNYNVFSNEYKKISNKVPEWKGYFDVNAVNQLGKDLKSGDAANAGVEIGTIAATCEKCMGERRAQVWAKYYWRDFDTVNVSTHGVNITWIKAMDALAGTYEGIAVNAEKGNKSQTNDSFTQFEGLYTDVKEACKNCHDTPRLYYVSDDVFAKIDQMGANITANNLSAVIANQQELGIQCYRCHVLHMPAEDMKSKMTISASASTDETNTNTRQHRGVDMKNRNDNKQHNGGE